MKNDVLFSRDILFPTENISEPGCVHVDIYKPDKNSRIPIIVESKTEHSPVKHIDPIMGIIQSDILDRIFVDIRKNTNLYIVDKEGYSRDSDGKKYLKVVFKSDKKGIGFVSMDSI